MFGCTYLNPTPSNSTVRLDKCTLTGMLGYMLISKTNLYVFYFCKVVLKQQKHLKGSFFLSEYNYRMWSDLGCKFPG